MNVEFIQREFDGVLKQR